MSKNRGGRGRGSYASGKTNRGRQDARDDGWGGIGGYMDARRQKLNDQFVQDRVERLSDIFEGVRIYINGYTKPPSDELRRIMQRHGGKHEMYLSKRRVTHIVATSLPNSKFHLAKTMPVVKPEWITDSVAAGKLLPHVDYLLLGNQSKLQPGLKFAPSASPVKKSSLTTSSEAEPSSFTGMKARASTRDEKNVVESVEAGEQVCHNEDGDDVKDVRKSNVNSVMTESSTEGMNRISSSVNPSSEEIWNENEKESIHTNCSDEESEIVYGSEDESYASPMKLNIVNFPVRSQQKSFEEGSSSLRNSVKSVHLSHDFPEDPQKNQSSPVSTGEYRKNKVFNDGLNNGESFQLAEHEPKGSLENGSPSKPSHSPQKPPPPSSSSYSSPSSFSMANKAGDKGFLSEYYSNSRLHHLSTWGAEFKAYVAEIQKEAKADSFPGRERLRQAHVDNACRLGMEESLEAARHSVQERTVMHVDMDCFFVSVGLLARPELRGKPVAVTHSRGQGQSSKQSSGSDAAWEKTEWRRKREGNLKTQTSPQNNGPPPRVEYDFQVPEGSTGTQTFQSFAEIASCSYEAREKGAKNGMFMGPARSLCPELQTIPYDFAEYNRISKILYDTVASYTHDIEAVSCDEMLVDCTDLLADTGATALEFASLLRSEMMDKTGCPASAGIGPNVLLAKLATRKAKPNGQFQVLSCDAKSFIRDQDVSKLPGVGYSMTRKLAKLNVTTCGDLQAVPVSRLRAEFGPKTGESLHQYSIGHDEREVKGDKQRKSVSAEVNYGIRFTKELEAISFFKELANEVQERLLKLKVKGQSITLKLMIRRPDAPKETAKFMGHGICNHLTKSTNLPIATNDGQLIGREVIAMYKSHNVSATDIRGIGIQIQKLEPEGVKGFMYRKQSTGHQSILNFAVAGGKEANQATAQTSSTSASKDVSASSTPLLDRSRTRPEGSKTLELHSSTTSPVVDERAASGPLNFSKQWQNVSESKSGDIGNSNNAKDTRDVPLPDQVDMTSLTDVSFLLSPSQVNADVLKELPEDIANEIWAGIERHGRRKGIRVSTSTPVPKQPSLPHQSSCVQRSQTPPENRPGPSRCQSSMPATGREAVVAPNEAVDFPSLSQMNPEVLEELPKDIADEIRAAGMERSERRKKKLCRGPSSSSSSTTTTPNNGDAAEDPNLLLAHSPGPAPGPSHAVAHATAIPSGSSEDSNGETISELPSMSQVDFSCFQALPKHMQIELQAAYTKQRTAPHGSEGNRAIVRGTALDRLKSPSKDKRGKHSGTGKRRGRPPGKKRLAFEDRGHSKVSPVKRKRPCDLGLAERDTDVVIVVDEEEEEEEEVRHVTSEDEAQPMVHQEAPPEAAESTPERNSSTKTAVVSFCGAESVFQVRRLLKEWLNSSQDPGEDDVAMVTEYLISLIKARFLEQAFCHLRFLIRHVSSSSCQASWKESVDHIACLVQSTVWDLYGSSLKL